MGFFDAMTGGDDAEKAIKKGQQQATASIQQGQQQASNVLMPGANYAPIQSRLYDLSGVNGGQAQQTAFGQFQESPEFAFQRQQGEQAAQRAAAAGGQLASGRTLADLSRFGQGLANQSYGQYYDRLAGLYGTSLGTAGQLANLYSNTGNTLGNLQMQGGLQRSQYANQSGNFLSDLLSQGIAGGAYVAGSAYGVK